MRWTLLLPLLLALTARALVQVTLLSVQDLVVQVELVGSGDTTTTIPQWHLPTSNSYFAQFVVKPLLSNGTEAEYLGRLGKRAASSPSIVLANGSRIVEQINLATLYDFSLAGGQYAVQFQSGALLSNTIVLDAPNTTTSALIPSPKRVKCSSSKLKIFAQAKTSAHAMAIDAITDVNRDAPKYKLWFGKITNARKNTVRSHFNLIRNALNKPETIAADCECENDRDLYAYVYPAQYRNKVIYLCGAFWQAKLATGADNKAGTVIHELSHFNDLGKTGDLVYTQPRCKKLALNAPQRAIRNADSHEYFAEL